MNQKLGIWIDTKQAILVTLNENDADIKTITSELETKVRFEGEGKEFGRFGDQYLDAERKKERRLDNEKQHFLDIVTDAIKKADKIVILGPAQMKTALMKKVESQPVLKGKVLSVETADSMTNNQLVAWVKQYFS